MVKRMASMNTRLNIEKLDGNIVQNHEGSKQVSDDTVVAQRRLEDKQPEEKTNTDCLVKEHTGWKIKTGNVLDSFNQRSTQQCMKGGVAKHLGVGGIQQQNRLVNETNVTLFAKVCYFLIQSGLSKVFRAKDTTRNMGFNESGEYKKTFIGFGVGTGSMHVLQGVEFEVEPQEDHTFEVEPHVACEVISKWKSGLKDDMDARSDVYVLSNDDMVFSCGCEAEIWATKGLLDKAKRNVLGMEIVKDQSGYTLRVSQSRFYNGKLVRTLLEGHSILSLEGSLSGDYDVEKNDKWSCIYAVGSQKYQMVHTILDIASADVGSLKANLQHMEALSKTEAGYMTFTEG
nr:zinc finger, CCHC-type [Tanacetum cinerariifolium]